MSKLSLKEKIGGIKEKCRTMGKNIDTSLPLENQLNVTFKEYVAVCVQKIGTQMVSILSGSYGATFLYECFYGSQGITSSEVASISAILTTVTTVLGYLMGVITASVAFKWKTKYGKYRQWFVLGLVPYIALNIMAFIVPDLGRQGLITYKFVIAILNTVLSGFYGISGNIVQVISPNVEEKKSVITIQQIFYYVGYGLAYIVPFVFGLFSKNKEVMYLVAIIIACVIASVGSVMCFAWCKERIELPKKHKVRVTGATIGLFKYKNYVVFHVLNWLGTISMTGTMVSYLTAIVVGSDKAILFALPSAIGTGVGVAIGTFISRKLEPVTILKGLGIWTPITAVATFLVVYFTGNYSGVAFLACYFLFGISFGIGDMSKNHLNLEFNDYLEWKTGERMEAVQGIIPGWIGSAISYGKSILIPFMLAWLGYNTNTGSINLMEYMKAQPTYDKTCLWLLGLALFGTALYYLIRAIILTFFYDIKGENKKKMYKELGEMRAKKALNGMDSVNGRETKRVNITRII